MPQVIIANAQQITKDCFAPVPKIDLTLRCNGEEKVSLIDTLGNVIPAGIDAPTAAPTITTGATACVWGSGSIPDPAYWSYRYVYVGKNAYPLVENAVTGGGSPAPRSNPSPSVAANSSANAALSRVVSIPTSQRSDISHVWVYRTELFTTAQAASDFGDAGNMFWIGEVANNPNSATVTLDDPHIVSLEQIENDNFPALQAKYCVYVDPYFWAIGNDMLVVAVSLNSSGVVTRNDGVPWFNGRDGQSAYMDGITSGGYDNHGNFYVKILSPTQIQLYQDRNLTQATTPSVTGTTQIHIHGPATVLFRSKPRNPFSWGFTDFVGDVQVPQPYAFSVGGGLATSITVLPNLNLLKIDTEAPSRSYTLNLKLAGTPNFEPSLRPISDTYCNSVNWAQFSATVDKGRNQIWGLDTNKFTVFQCDGASQNPVSDPIYKSLRDLSLGNDKQFFHGNYLPRLELNCFFVRTSGVEGLINRCFYHHWPTNQWGMIDAFDVLCSAQLLDPYTNETKLIVGTSAGNIGEFGTKDRFNNWCPPNVQGIFTASAEFPNLYTVLKSTLDSAGVPDLTLEPSCPNTWILIWDSITTEGKLCNFRFASVANVSIVTQVDLTSFYVFDVSLQFYDRNFLPIDTTPGVPVVFPFPYPLGPTYFSFGAMEMLIGRFFTGSIPFNGKKIEEVLSTVFYTETAVGSIPPPNIAFGLNYGWRLEPDTRFVSPNNIPTRDIEYPAHSYAENKPLALTEGAGANMPIVYGRKTAIPIDTTTVFGIIISDRNQKETTLMNYEIRATTDGSIS